MRRGGERAIVEAPLNPCRCPRAPLWGRTDTSPRWGRAVWARCTLGRDTRLDRMVAIKVLPSHSMANAEAIERFEREARAISRLNHPNVCTLYDVGQVHGVRLPRDGVSGGSSALSKSSRLVGWT